jgi:hypothetical protein
MFPDSGFKLIEFVASRPTDPDLLFNIAIETGGGRKFVSRINFEDLGFDNLQEMQIAGAINKAIENICKREKNGD